MLFRDGISRGFSIGPSRKTEDEGDAGAIEGAVTIEPFGTPLGTGEVAVTAASSVCADCVAAAKTGGSPATDAVGAIDGESNVLGDDCCVGEEPLPVAPVDPVGIPVATFQPINPVTGPTTGDVAPGDGFAVEAVPLALPGGSATETGGTAACGKRAATRARKLSLSVKSLDEVSGLSVPAPVTPLTPSVSAF